MRSRRSISGMSAVVLMLVSGAWACDKAGTPTDLVAAAAPNPKGKRDTTPPTVPQNLKASVISSVQIDLAWSPSTDNKSVAGYEIYRDNAKVGTTSRTAYSATGLSPQTTYTFKVLAYDAAGNRSDTSAPVSATTLPPPNLGGGDPIRGQALFVAECSSCHTSRDGLDLPYFHMSSSDILRRAQPHVGSPGAEDIAAYISTLAVNPAPNKFTRIYQPGGRILSSDVEFAVNLFGKDEWPDFSTWGTQRLLALTALDVPVAIPMPFWSDEIDNSDWMPAIAPREKFIARTYLDAYYADRTKIGQLIKAITDTQYKLLDAADPDAPCPGRSIDDAPRYQAVECFESMKWVANLVGQHLIRNGLPRTFDNRLSAALYRVGYQARQAIKFGKGAELGPNANLLWAQWAYLGWAIQRPYINNPFYVAEAMPPMNLHRHGTFLLLRDAVDGARGSLQPYEDVMSLGHHSLPGEWTYRPTKWGLEHLLERLNNGDVPADRAQARSYMEVRIPRNVQSKVTPAQWAVLDSLIKQIAAKLQ